MNTTQQTMVVERSSIQSGLKFEDVHNLFFDIEQ